MSLFFNQLKAVTYRNYLIKKNNKSKTIQEIFFPLYFVLLIFALRFAGKSKIYDAEDSTVLGDISSLLSVSPEQNTIGFVLPGNNNDEIISNVMMNPVFKEKNYQYARFNNEEELEEYNKNNNNLIAGIIFEENLFTYTIRINGTEISDPDEFPIGNYGQSRAGAPIGLNYLNKFSYIQSVVDSSIISIKTNNPVSINTIVGSISKPSINHSNLSGSSSKLYATYMNFIFFVHIIVIVTFIVEEKEKKIKEGMLMAGVNSAVFWLSWEIIYTVIIVITSIIITIIFVAFKSFEYTNPIVIFIIIALYGLSNCGLGFVFSTFFKKAKTAASFAGIIITFICIIYMAVSYLDKKIQNNP